MSSCDAWHFPAIYLPDTHLVSPQLLQLLHVPVFRAHPNLLRYREAIMIHSPTPILSPANLVEFVLVPGIFLFQLAFGLLLLHDHDGQKGWMPGIEVGCGSTGKDHACAHFLQSPIQVHELVLHLVDGFFA